MKLSQHFTLEELSVTNNTVFATENKNDAIRYIDNLTSLCVDILEPIRKHFNLPITVNSGHRCRNLNSAIGGAKDSQHCYGEAVDFTVVNVSVESVFLAVLHQEIEGLDYDKIGQVIQEKNRWIHISIFSDRYSVNHDCFQALRFDGVKYTRVN